MLSLNVNVNEAHEHLQQAKLFFSNLPVDADNDLIQSAIYNLKSTEHYFNYALKQAKNI